MFGRVESDPRLERAIGDVYEKMDVYSPDDAEYPALIAYLERLNKLKKGEPRERVSWDTIAIVVGNLLSIGVIVIYEQKHIMSSKAWTERLKPKGRHIST